MEKKGILYVEGPNDEHVTYALCQKHKLPETFRVEAPGGVTKLLEVLPVRLKESDLQAIGIVIDADASPKARWNAVTSVLRKSGYKNLPTTPTRDGTVIVEKDKAIVGIWLMPDNNATGKIEDFIKHLVPSNDQLRVGFETHAGRPRRRTSSMMEAT